MAHVVCCEQFGVIFTVLCDVRVLVGVRARAARALYHVSGSLFSFCVCPSQPLKIIFDSSLCRLVQKETILEVELEGI